MIPQEYLKTIRGILDHLEKTQLPAVEKAASLVVDSLANGGTVHCSEVGHGIQGDFIGRAGGLMAVQPFTFNFTLNDPVAGCLRDRPRPDVFQKELETIRFAVKAGNLRAGDVMIVASVSGRNVGPIELALACRVRGMKVIGITSLAYTAQIVSMHPSGKKLCDVVDVVIDNGAPFGDAAVEVPGIAVKVMPVSGVAADVAGWMIWGRVMEKMAAAGTPPSVYMSVNRPGGPEFNEKAKEQYEERGY
jgi:uncharacterized phosphosugar-binding protein